LKSLNANQSATGQQKQQIGEPDVPAIKDYFETGKRQKLLEDALKKSKDGDKRPCAFGIGKSGAFLALDFRNEHSPEKMLKEIKKTDFKDRFIVGTATIQGKIIAITSVEKKGSIRPKDIKEFLTSGIKSKVSRAVIDGVADEEDQATGGAFDSASVQIEQRRVELTELERELAQMAAQFQIKI
jgi:hypothetical protein